MRVVDVYKGGTKREFTLMKLDCQVPCAPCRRILIDGIEYLPVAMSGGGKDTLCIQGHHDVVGGEVSLLG